MWPKLAVLHCWMLQCPSEHWSEVLRSTTVLGWQITWELLVLLAWFRYQCYLELHGPSWIWPLHWWWWYVMFVSLKCLASPIVVVSKIFLPWLSRWIIFYVKWNKRNDWKCSWPGLAINYSNVSWERVVTATASFAFHETSLSMEVDANCQKKCTRVQQALNYCHGMEIILVLN